MPTPPPGMIDSSAIALEAWDWATQTALPMFAGLLALLIGLGIALEWLLPSVWAFITGNFHRMRHREEDFSDVDWGHQLMSDVTDRRKDW